MSERIRVCIVSRKEEAPLLSRQAWLRGGAADVETRDFDSLSDVVGRFRGGPDLVVVHAPDVEVPQRLGELRALSDSVPVAVWSPEPTVRGAVNALRSGAIDYLSPTPTPSEIEELLRRARAHRLAGAKEEAGTDDPFQDLIGDSPVMRRLRREIDAVARHDATVLLQGETGTGKERVARLIHRLSARAPKPFVICNCSAVVASLAESELFGHEKGAFTGARKAKAGLFEAARGGTLFLDQVQELAIGLQPKLLRVLENREFTRLGSTRMQKADVRIIAAANRDLRDEVRDKRFREDLFYRLNTALLTIPPLRERREDLPLLVEHFLAYFSRHFAKPARVISREAMAWIMSHPWEGNVRELRNTVERAVAVSRRRVISKQELRVPGAARPAAAPTGELAPAELISLDELERRQIRRVLEMTGGNRERAAKALGLSRSTLYRRLSELGF